MIPDDLESQHTISLSPIITAADTIMRKNLEARFKLEVGNFYLFFGLSFFILLDFQLVQS